MYQFLGNVYPKQVLEHYSKGLIIVYAFVLIGCLTTGEMISTPSELLFSDILLEHILGSKLKFYAIYQLFICLYTYELMDVTILGYSP